MAEAIGLTSSLLALSVFAFESSVSLYKLVSSIQNSNRAIRLLKQELEELEGVLESLHQAIESSNADYPALKLPLSRCGQACKEFEELISKCTTHSTESRTSIRDWGKMKYMGGDIAAFKDMLAGYKSTIMIALADANFRTAAVTSKVLQQYQLLINETTSDLQGHLSELEVKLEDTQAQKDGSSYKPADRATLLLERDSTKKCLEICAQVSQQINISRPDVFENISTTTDTIRPSAKKATSHTLGEIQSKLHKTTSDLETHMYSIDDKLRSLSTANETPDIIAERERAEQEKRTVEQCLTVCDQAREEVNRRRTNVFEDVSAGEETNQVLVSTIEDLIHVKRVTAGPRSNQVMGQMSDDTVQNVVQHHPSKWQSVTLQPKQPTPDAGSKPPTSPDSAFGSRYGMGQTLK